MKRLNAIILISFITGCTTPVMNAGTFLKWVENSTEIVSKKTVDHYEFSLKYLPAAFLALRDLKNRPLNQKEVQQTTETYLCSYNFIFKIADKEHNKDVLGDDIDSKSDYQKRMDYYISALQDDLFLTDGSDTIPCRLCNFERTYNLNPFLTFYLLFDKKGRQNEKFDHDLTLIYNDRALGVGRINITLEKSDLNEIPKLLIP